MAKQCLHRAKVFSVSHTSPPASRTGVHKKLGGTTAGADEQCRVTPCSARGEIRREGGHSE